MIERIAGFLFLLLMPFFYLGIINKVKAFWAGRKGAPLLQPLFDFIRLLRKGEVVSRTASLVFQIAPVVSFTAVLFSGLLVPLVQRISMFPMDASFVLFAYMLGLGRFFLILGALDTGSSFEGMGASREAAFGSLIEPAFFIIMGTLALLNRGLSFPDVLNLAQNPDPFFLLITVLASAALFIMLLTEGSRVPVDDPNTHLELTMIHEVMVLDNSGPDLALLLYGSGMKMVVITSLIAALILPKDWNFISSALGWLGIQSAAAVLIGTVESQTARLRMMHVVQFVFVMISLALIILSAAGLWVSGGLK